MKNILFVCTGNTCRSAMAKGILEAYLKKEPELSEQYSVESAGTAVPCPEAASPNAVTVLKEQWGIDLESHRSRELSSQLVERADLILTMTRSHKDAVLLKYPQMASKVFTLKEYVLDQKPFHSMEAFNYSLDISDPYGMSLEIYKKCALEVKTAIDKLVSLLKKSPLK